MGFFGDLFGGGQRKDINRSSKNAQNIVDDYYGQGRTAITQGLDRALGFLQPQIDAANTSREAYETAIGLKGQEAQGAFYDTFMDDPGFAAEVQAGQDSVERLANARGYSMSGRGMAEVGEYGQLKRREAFQDRLNRLERLSGRGEDTAKGAAQMIYQGGSDTAGSYFGQGGMKANIELGRGQAIANTRFTLGDLANVIGGVGKAVAAFI